MKEFTLAEDSLPFNFFVEIGFSFQDLAIECIKRRFTTFSLLECEIIFNKNYDLFSEKIYDIKDSSSINDYCIGEEEIGESSGTWRYFHFEVDDIEKAKMKLEEEAKHLLDEIVNDIQT